LPVKITWIVEIENGNGKDWQQQSVNSLKFSKVVSKQAQIMRSLRVNFNPRTKTWDNLPIYTPSDDPKEWLEKFNNTAKLNEWVDADSLEYLPSFINATVSQWFHTQHFETLDHFEQAFTAKYSKELTTPEEYVDILLAQQEAGELVDDYIERFRAIERNFKRASKAIGREDLAGLDTTNFFVNGLYLDRLRQRVISAKADSLVKAMEIASVLGKNAGRLYASVKMTQTEGKVSQLTQRRTSRVIPELIMIMLSQRQHKKHPNLVATAVQKITQIIKFLKPWLR
jgi:hypothetical protein